MSAKTDHTAQARGLFSVNRHQHLFLGLEVEIDRTLGETGRRGDLGHRCEIFRVMREQALGRLQNRRAARCLVFGLNGADNSLIFLGFIPAHQIA